MGTRDRILIAGATGVIGRRLVASLTAAGHEVHGLARNGKSAELIRGLGGTPVAGDILDAESIDRAVAEVRPMVVLHQATWLARLAGGRHAVRTMTTQRGASNRRAKHQLRWRPEYRSWREGIAATQTHDQEGAGNDRAVLSHG